MKRTLTLVFLSLVFCGVEAGAVSAVSEHMAALPSQWNKKKIIY